ncbi:MAG: spondin domain-containing protein [Myxococcota bacterium]
MISRPIFTALTLSALGAALTVPSDAEASRYHRRHRVYEVVITNLTRGQILSPPIVATHRPGFRIFEVGMPASPELAAVAEDAVNAGLETLLDGSSRVFDRQTGGAPIPPGQSAALEITADRWATRLSSVGMLVVTNDAFFGFNGVKLPNWGSRTYRAVAYDAGSEANTEDCDDIPGPPCGNPGVRQTVDAEGYVHVHAGIHGLADLVPSRHDWRNPTVQITITRIR